MSDDKDKGMIIPFTKKPVKDNNFKKVEECANKILNLPIDLNGNIEAISLIIDADKYNDLLLEAGFTEDHIKAIQAEKKFFQNVADMLVGDFTKRNPDIDVIQIFLSSDIEQSDDPDNEG